MNKFLSGFLFGGLSAGLVTLLTTPHDGKTNYRLFKERVKQLTSQVEDVSTSTNQLQEALNRLKTEGLSTAKVFASEVGSTLTAFQTANAPRFKRLNGALDQLQKDLDSTSVTEKN